MNKIIITIILATCFINYNSFAKSKNILSEMWSDPAFKKDFTASYGVLSGYEPEINQEEKERLRSIYETINANPLDAIIKLENEITDSDSAAFDFILANLYFQENQLTLATQYYNQAINKYPNFRRAYSNLGLVYIIENNFESAITCLSKALELGVVDARSYGLLGYSYYTQGNYYPAEAAYRQAILMQPEVLDWKTGLAQCLLEMGQYQDAVVAIQTLIDEDPSNTDYWILQSNAYLGLDQTLKAASNLEVVKRLGKSDLNILSLLGDIYMNNEMPELALVAYLEAINLAKETNLDTLVHSAELFTRLGNYKEAESFINEIRSNFNFEKNSNNEEDLKLLICEAKIARSKGEDDLAASLLIKIIERDLLNGDAIIELANYYADKGMFSEAYTRFEQAQSILEHERPALIAHAQVLVSQKKYSSALSLLNRALLIESDRNLKDFKNKVEKASRNQ